MEQCQPKWQVNAANANINGTDNGIQNNNTSPAGKNGQNVHLANQSNGERPDNAHSSGSGNKGGQAGNDFGRVACQRGLP